MGAGSSANDDSNQTLESIQDTLSPRFWLGVVKLKI